MEQSIQSVAVDYSHFYQIEISTYWDTRTATDA